MLTLERVNYRRGDFRLSADLVLPAPGVTAVIGPSGGGKSTLLSLVAGFEHPDSGRILWQDLDLAPLDPGDRPVAILFQDNNLFPHLNVLANTALGVEPRVTPSKEALDRAEKALAKVGLAGFVNRKPGDLSGGQQSRAALARILLTRKEVILMDEAFSALGPAQRGDMLDLVTELLPEATILMVTHDPEDAKRIAGQVIFVEAGEVHAPEDTAQLFENPHPALARYLS